MKSKIKRGPKGTADTQTDDRGWVKPEDGDKQLEGPGMVSTGMVTVLTMKNR